MQNLNKHSRLPRKFGSDELPKKVARQSRDVSADEKQSILDEAKTLILRNWTIAQIAAKYEIQERTMEYWLADLGDEYKDLRKLWIDNMLSEASELLGKAKDAFQLAKARELLKRAMWYAERRDRHRYGEDKQQINVAVVPVLQITTVTVSPADHATALEVRQARTLEHKP